MRFCSLTITQGFLKNQFTFSEGMNLVHNKKNSVGKTTLLRFLMYSLGYPIPNIRSINFSNYELELQLIDENNNLCRIKRERDFVAFDRNDESYNYSLPFDLHNLHNQIFGIKNEEVLDNLLGVFYVDQEKGWTLLNRGKVIGNIHFSIESLIRGLSDRTSDDLYKKLAVVKHEIEKYRSMFSVAQYQSQINAFAENIVFDTSGEQIEKELDVLYCERKPVSDEFERIKSVIRKNNTFQKYISSMQIVVSSKNGEKIPVNEDTIVGFRDNTEYLSAKLKLIANQITEMDRKINTLLQRQQKENILFEVETRIEAFDADISKIKVDAVATGNIIKKLEQEQKMLEDTITQKIKMNNPIISELHTLISGYTKKLGITDEYMRPNTDYIFTNDLKSLSGAIFHKIVFAFKISYIKLIFNHLGVKLPIILDSPAGREIDKDNIATMMSIIADDFTGHQIIIASIYEYNFPNMHVIELGDRLLSNYILVEGNQ